MTGTPVGVAVDPLIAALTPPGEGNEDPLGPAQWYCQALGRIADPRAVPLLIECIERPYLAGPVICALKVIRDPRAFEPILRYFEA